MRYAFLYTCISRKTRGLIECGLNPGRIQSAFLKAPNIQATLTLLQKANTNEIIATEYVQEYYEITHAACLSLYMYF
jgi:hypothetical protein